MRSKIYISKSAQSAFELLFVKSRKESGRRNSTDIRYTYILRRKEKVNMKLNLQKKYNLPRGVYHTSIMSAQEDTLWPQDITSDGSDGSSCIPVWTANGSTRLA